MGKTRPILQGTVSNWRDGVTDYGAEGEINPDLTLYILAHRSKEYELRRTEDDEEEIGVTESRFKLFDPEELSVDQHNSLRSDGYHFHDITMDDLVRMLQAGFDGRSCTDG